jgi:hypothetical protein
VAEDASSALVAATAVATVQEQPLEAMQAKATRSAKPPAYTGGTIPMLAVADVEGKNFTSQQRKPGLTRPLLQLYCRDMGIAVSHAMQSDDAKMKVRVLDYMRSEPASAGMLNGVYWPRWYPARQKRERKAKRKRDASAPLMPAPGS